MIQTDIQLGKEGNFPVMHKSTGLAKNLSVAKWLFAYLGWDTGREFPALWYVVETIEWPEGDKYFPANEKELWVLGNCLQMN